MPTVRGKLIKKLDKVFSQYIRTRNVDESGYSNCFTCNSLKHWKEVDAGHFMSRGKFATRWAPKNVQFQCKRCNGFRSGEQYKFAQQLDNIYGEGTADDLVVKSNQSAKFNVIDLREMIVLYTNKCEQIKKAKGI